MKQEIIKIGGLRLNLSEIAMVFAGLLFFASTAWIASGGSFAVLLTAKAVYFIGLVLLLL
jgi:hypothetical protein